MAEPLVISLEGQGALAITQPQARWFGPGGALAVAAHYPLSPIWLLGVRLRAGLLSDGAPPEQAGVQDPGSGSFELATFTLRVRPFSTPHDARLGTGLFVDVGAGGGVTGKLVRPSIEGGVGYGFALGPICLAPTLRYLQVIQPQEAPSGADARLLLAGVELTFHDARPAPRKPPPHVVTKSPQSHGDEKAKGEDEKAAAAERDADGDGIADAADGCPDVAEDLDGFEDADGCPDPDNDKDGVVDAQDRCPTVAEDHDQFEDEDGCPDPDNDGDGIADADDQCPDAAEVVNGIEDGDGCPDVGEIVFRNGRIVLDERVLFDFERARVKTRAKPVLNAIVRLLAQHPDWDHIHIEGHTDARGHHNLNQALSERRARNVMRALIALGVPEDQLSSAGYGATRLRDHGTTERAHQRNRRVEFVVETHEVVRSPDTAPPLSIRRLDGPGHAAPLEHSAHEQHAPAAEPEHAAAQREHREPVEPAVSGGLHETAAEHAVMGSAHAGAVDQTSAHGAAVEQSEDPPEHQSEHELDDRATDTAAERTDAAAHGSSAQHEAEAAPHEAGAAKPGAATADEGSAEHLGHAASHEDVASHTQHAGDVSHPGDAAHRAVPNGGGPRSDERTAQHADSPQHPPSTHNHEGAAPHAVEPKQAGDRDGAARQREAPTSVLHERAPRPPVGSLQQPDSESGSGKHEHPAHEHGSAGSQHQPPAQHPAKSADGDSPNRSHLTPQPAHDAPRPTHAEGH